MKHKLPSNRCRHRFAPGPTYPAYQDTKLIDWIMQAASLQGPARYTASVILDNMEAAHWMPGEAPFQLLRSKCRRRYLASLVASGLRQLAGAGMIRAGPARGRAIATIEIILSPAISARAACPRRCKNKPSTERRTSWRCSTKMISQANNDSRLS
jgi:hypothetical protein